MNFLLLALLYVAVDARPELGCKYSDWGAWGTCVSSRQCPVRNPGSFQSEPQVWDTTRIVMEHMKQVKKENNNMKAACRMDPECHTFDRAASTGAHPCISGMAEAKYPCQNINMLSLTDFNDLGYDASEVGENPAETAGSDIWGWTDPVNGEEYAIMTISGGTSFVRIAADGSTATVGILYSHNTATIWRDVKTVGNYAYIGSEADDHGMQVFDMTRLRGLGVTNPVARFLADAHYDGFGQSHNIVASDDINFVYGVGSTGANEGSRFPLASQCNGGLFAVDVSNPLNPTYAGCFGTDGYTHDAQCVIYHGPDATYQGKEICFAYNENSLTIVDVSDKSNMALISRTTYTGVEYSHQGWLTENHEVLLLDDELDEYQKVLANNRRTKTYIWDVKTLSAPVLRTTFLHTSQSIDHNQYVVGEYTYQMNYESGLRIMRIDEAGYNLAEVGFFDLYDLGTVAQFNGGWSVYPFFSSGNLILSSVEYGLFVVKADMTAIELMPGAMAEETRVRASFGDDCSEVTERRTCTETLQC